MDLPTTAIVILNYNSLEYFKQYLPDLVKHTPSWSTIYIIDNGSTEESESWVKENYPSIYWIALGDNFGFAEGYNKGLTQIDEECFVLLNSDIKVTQNWLTPLVKKLYSDEKIAAIQPKILDLNQTYQFEHAGAAGGMIDWLGYPFCRGRIFDTVEKDQGQYDDSIECFWTSGACMAIKSTLFRKVGGFDARFFMHMEEIDLCWRLQRLGYTVNYISSSSVYHVGGGSLAYANPKKTYYNFRNNLIMLVKNLPILDLIPILCIRSVFDWIAAFKELIQLKPKHTISIGKAWLSLLLGLFQWKTKYNISQYPKTIDNIYKRSIVIEFFLKNRKTYTSLQHEGFNRRS